MGKQELRNMLESSQMLRRSGKTTILANAAKELGATLVCANKSHARHIEKEFGLKTVIPFTEIRGTPGPYIWDHYAMELVALSALSTITTLENEKSKLQEQIQHQDQRIDMLLELLSEE